MDIESVDIVLECNPYRLRLLEALNYREMGSTWIFPGKVHIYSFEPYGKDQIVLKIRKKVDSSIPMIHPITLHQLDTWVRKSIDQLEPTRTRR